MLCTELSMRHPGATGVVVARCPLYRRGLLAVTADTGLSAWGRVSVRAVQHSLACVPDCTLDVLTCRLPDGLLGILDDLVGLADGLSSSRLPRPAYLILLTTMPAGWVHDTLAALATVPESLPPLTVLPDGVSPTLLRAVMLRQPVPWWSAMPADPLPLPGLTREEVQCLRAVMHIGSGQAHRARGYMGAVLRRAMRKLGVSTVKQLLQWQPVRISHRRTTRRRNHTPTRKRNEHTEA